MKKLIISILILLPLQVLSSQDRIISNKKTTKSEHHRWLIGIQAGRSNMLASTVKDERDMTYSLGITKQEAENYYKQLKRGWNFAGDIHYLFSDYFGLGVKYSLFTSSAADNFLITSRSFLPLFSTSYLEMSWRENLYIHYAGPSVIFRQRLAGSRKFLISPTFSAGFVYYHNELRTTFENVLAERETWGINPGLAFAYHITPRLMAGANGNFFYARLKKMNFHTADMSQTVFFGNDDYVNITRFDYSISINFNF